MKIVSGNTATADLAWILPLCFGIRVLYAFSLESLPALPPSDGYIDIAKNITTGNGFGPSEFRPLYLRTPGYPLFLSVLIGSLDASVRYPAIVLAQITLSTASCGVLYVLARNCLGTRVARLAATFFAFSPSSIIFCTLIFPETLQILLITLAALSVALLYRNATVGYAVAFGVLWGFAGLTRPEATYVLPAMLVPLVVQWRKQWRLLSKLIGTAVIAKGFVMLPWIIRNATVYGALVTHVPVSGSLLYFGSYPHPPMYGRFWYHSEGMLENITTTTEYQDIVRTYRAKSPLSNQVPRHWNEIVVNCERTLIDVDRKLAEHAMYNITNYRTSQLRNLAFHFYDLWKRPAGWGYDSLIEFKWIWFLGFVVFLLSALAGAVYLAVSEGFQGVVGGWLMFVLVYTALLLFTYTEPRYQASSIPFLCIFSAAFLTRFFSQPALYDLRAWQSLTSRAFVRTL